MCVILPVAAGCNLAADSVVRDAGPRTERAPVISAEPAAGVRVLPLPGSGLEIDLSTFGRPFEGGDQYSGACVADETLYLLERDRTEDGRDDGTIHRIDLRTGERESFPLRELGCSPFTPVGAAVHEGVLYLCSPGYLYRFALDGPAPRYLDRIDPGISGSHRGLEIVRGTAYITEAGTNVIWAWETATGALRRWTALPGHANVYSVAAGKGFVFAVDAFHDVIYLLDPHAGRIVRELHFHENGFGRYSFFTYGGLLFGVDNDAGAIRQYRFEFLGEYAARSDPRTVRFELLVRWKNTDPVRTVTGARFVFGLPESDGHQDVGVPRFIGGEPVIERDRYGSAMAVFSGLSVPPGGALSVGYSVDATLWGVRYRIPREYRIDPGAIDAADRELYLDSGPAQLALDSSVLREAAAGIPGDRAHPAEFIRNVRDAVFGRLSYGTDGGWSAADIVWGQGEGSCSEYSFVTSAILRHSGYATRFVGASAAIGWTGEPHDDETHHRWIEVLIPGLGWVPMDANRNDSDSREYWSDEYVFGADPDMLTLMKGGGGDDGYLGIEYTYEFSYRWSPSGGSSSNLERSDVFSWVRTESRIVSDREHQGTD